jgi:chromosome segregation ATPase
MNLEQKKQEIRSKLDKAVLPKVKELVEKRGKAREKLERLQKALPEHESKLEKLNFEVDGLIDKVAEALGEGKDPAPERAKVRKAQDEVAEIKGTILSLREKFIPEAQASLKSVERDLKDAMTTAVRSVCDECEKRMAELVDEALSWWESYNKMAEALYVEHGIGPIAGLLDTVPRFRKSEKLERYARDVMRLG